MPTDANKISGGRWDRVLRSKFGLKGIGPTSARISDDISPTYNFPFYPEDNFLIGDKLMWARGVSVGDVAKNPRLILTNISTNKLLIMERLMADHAGSGFMYMGATSAIVPFVVATPTYSRDGRWGALETDQGGGAARFQDATLVGAPLPIIQSFSVPQEELDFKLTVVLAPGDSFFLTNGTVNTTVIGTFWWREHVMEETERA